MAFIFGTLLILAIIYRIYVTVSQMITMIKKPIFWKATFFYIVYIYLSIFIIEKFSALLNFIFDYLPLNLIFIILFLGIMLIPIYFIGYLYYAILCKKYPQLILPLHFTLLIVSLGLIALKLYNINNLNQSDKTFVDPHHVNGYTKSDGTQVSGYWRDGDGNPNTTLTREEGGGYFRS